MDNFQFYPTPPDLALRAWKKFTDKNFIRVLEPHGGNGDLALAYEGLSGSNLSCRYRREVKIDCCEIDVTKHAVLREKHLNVVGMDFLQFRSGSIYSHIIMNPPFATGVSHVLKAWDAIWDGEIVAIVNAETLRNPFSKERQFLVDLVAEHGEVEFIENAFAVPEAERKTNVDVALIWLRKRANVSEDIIGPIVDGLQCDTSADTLADGFREAAEVALPNTLIENTVAAFNAAVRTMREAVMIEARAQYYARLIGDTMAVRNGDAGKTDAESSTSVDYVRNTIGVRYDELKDRAWASILRSANVTSKLSSAAQRRVEKEFEGIKELEFTVLNVYGFLCGIVESQGKIQIEMMCDVFDIITRYHSDNTVFYKGWKSNDKHRTCAMRVKTTRFILPGHSTEYYQKNMPYESVQLLRDFDKVFAMLDSKYEPEIGLVDLFNSNLKELRAGERLSSSYFDVRYYGGIGTIHFFPRSKKLIDRLNVLVGRHREWLPQTEAGVSEAFWLQYQDAEKYDKEVRAEINKQMKGRSSFDHPLRNIYMNNDQRKELASEAVDKAVTAVLEKHGINVDFLIESGNQPNQLLLAA